MSAGDRKDNYVVLHWHRCNERPADRCYCLDPVQGAVWVQTGTSYPVNGLWAEPWNAWSQSGAAMLTTRK